MKANSTAEPQDERRWKGLGLDIKSWSFSFDPSDPYVTEPNLPLKFSIMCGSNSPAPILLLLLLLFNPVYVGFVSLPTKWILINITGLIIITTLIKRFSSNRPWVNPWCIFSYLILTIIYFKKGNWGSWRLSNLHKVPKQLGIHPDSNPDMSKTLCSHQNTLDWAVIPDENWAW